MIYVLDGDSVTIDVQKGMYFQITGIDTDGSVSITSTSFNETWPGTAALPYTITETFTLTASGKATVSVTVVGDITTAAIYDSNNSTGHYPGGWGTGIGSK